MVKVSKGQKKKKRWVSITAPAIFKEAPIGETPVYDPEEAVGRKLRLNLMILTRDPKKQNYNILFKISKVDGTKAQTEVVGYEVVSASMKRLVKRRKEKIDDSFVCVSKDGKKIRIKPLIVTNGKANNSTVTALRHKLRHVMAQYLEKNKFNDFIQNIVFAKQLFKFKDELKSTYPVKSLEIRKIAIAADSSVAIKAVDHDKKKKKKVSKKQKEDIEESQ